MAGAREAVRTATAATDPDPATMTPDALAAEVARRMWADDRASQALGMELLEVRSGYARIRMPIRRDMTNGHGICHGGYMFLLADSTFAFACNSHNQRAVAASAPSSGQRSSQVSKRGTTRATCVCWSMTSETRIA